jgi:hypothetical protein
MMRVRLLNGTVKKMTRDEMAEVICSELDNIEMDVIKKELLKRFYRSNVYDKIHYNLFEIQDIREIIHGDDGSVRSWTSEDRFEAKKLSDLLIEFIDFDYEDRYYNYDVDDFYKYKTYKELIKDFPEKSKFYDDFNYCSDFLLWTIDPYIDEKGNEWFLVDKDRYVG